MSDQTDTQLPIIPPEVIDIIAQYNPYAFAYTCEWHNLNYLLRVNIDYNSCVETVLHRCSDCDMIYHISDKDPNMRYSDMNSDKKSSVVLHLKAIYMHTSGYVGGNKLSANPHCVHRNHTMIYGFKPITLQYMADRARNGDDGLLRRILKCVATVPIRTWIRGIYKDLVKTGITTDIAARFFTPTLKYWARS